MSYRNVLTARAVAEDEGGLHCSSRLLISHLSAPIVADFLLLWLIRTSYHGGVALRRSACLRFLTAVFGGFSDICAMVSSGYLSTCYGGLGHIVYSASCRIDSKKVRVLHQRTSGTTHVWNRTTFPEHSSPPLCGGPLPNASQWRSVSVGQSTESTKM